MQFFRNRQRIVLILREVKSKVLTINKSKFIIPLISIMGAGDSTVKEKNMFFRAKHIKYVTKSKKRLIVKKNNAEDRRKRLTVIFCERLTKIKVFEVKRAANVFYRGRQSRGIMQQSRTNVTRNIKSNIRSTKFIVFVLSKKRRFCNAIEPRGKP